MKMIERLKQKIAFLVVLYKRAKSRLSVILRDLFEGDSDDDAKERRKAKRT